MNYSVSQGSLIPVDIFYTQARRANWQQDSRHNTLLIRDTESPGTVAASAAGRIYSPQIKNEQAS